MKTIFFSKDKDLYTLDGMDQFEIEQTAKAKEIAELVGEGPAILVLDFDLSKKEAQKLSETFAENENVLRVVVGKKFSTKELKAMQAEPNAANGYYAKPLTSEVFDELYEDFQLIAGVEEEEGIEDVEYDTSPTQVSTDEDKTAENIQIPEEIEEDLPQSEDIPDQLESVDGDAIDFEEGDADIVFDAGDGADIDDVTDPGITTPTMAMEASEETATETDVSAVQEESEPEEEVEFDLGEEEEGLQFDTEEAAAPVEEPEVIEDVDEEVEFDLSAEEEEATPEPTADEEPEVAFDVLEDDEEQAASDESDDIEIGEEPDIDLDDEAVEEAPSSGGDVTLSLGDDDSFGELELSNKSASKTEEAQLEEEEGEEDGFEAAEEEPERSDEDETGEFETVITEINDDPIDLSEDDTQRFGSENSEDETAPARARDDVRILSDEEKAAIARIEKIDYTYDENELVKSQVTIRHMREERQSLLKEIDILKEAVKEKDQNSLSLRAELDEAKIEISILKKRRNEDMENIKYQLRLSEEKKKIYEEKNKHYQEEFSKLDKKVRVDINQVRQREKDLENKLELTLMDADSQIKARDTKIAELKRKIDSLEFNMENVSINEQKLKDDKIRLEARISKIMSTLKNSISLIEDDLDFDDEVLLEKLNKL